MLMSYYMLFYLNASELFKNRILTPWCRNVIIFILAKAK